MVDFKSYFPLISQPAVHQMDGLVRPDSEKIVRKTGACAAATALLSTALFSIYGYASTGSASAGLLRNLSSVFFSTFAASTLSLVAETVRTHRAAGDANAETFLHTEIPSKSFMDEILKDRFTIEKLIEKTKGNPELLKKKNEEGQSLLSVLFMNQNWNLSHIFTFFTLVSSNTWTSREILLDSGIFPQNPSRSDDPLMRRNKILILELIKTGRFKVEDLTMEEKIVLNAEEIIDDLPGCTLVNSGDLKIQNNENGAFSAVLEHSIPRETTPCA